MHINKVIQFSLFCLYVSHLSASWSKGNAPFDVKAVEDRLQKLQALKTNHKKEEKLWAEINELDLPEFKADETIRNTLSYSVDTRLKMLENCKQEVAFWKKVKVLNPASPYITILVGFINQECTSFQNADVKQLKQSYQALIDMVNEFDAALKAKTIYRDKESVMPLEYNQRKIIYTRQVKIAKKMLRLSAMSLVGQISLDDIQDRGCWTNTNQKLLNTSLISSIDLERSIEESAKAITDKIIAGDLSTIDSYDRYVQSFVHFLKKVKDEIEK